MFFSRCGSGARSEQLYVDDVFSTHVYPGTGSPQSIDVDVDLDTHGGLVWSKDRTGSNHHGLVYTALGANKVLFTNLTSGQLAYTDNVTAFTETGYEIGNDATVGTVNQSGNKYLSWTFRNAPNFYWHDVVVKSGADVVIDFPELTTLGMVRVKRADATGSWYVWHRSLTAGKLLVGETTAAEATLGHITVSGTSVTLEHGVIADGTYVVEAFAHDDSHDGLIQCGSFSSDSSGNASVNLGWELQAFLGKRISGTGAWYMHDDLRGMNVDGNGVYLTANSSAAESTASATGVRPNASGFSVEGTFFGTDSTIAFVAIRRSNKPPESGAEVFAMDGMHAATSPSPWFTSNFKVDVGFLKQPGSSDDWIVASRLTGTKKLAFNLPGAEGDQPNQKFDYTAGFYDANASTNYYARMFRRAPGFMDVVCWKTTGAAHMEPHNLLVTPELIIGKVRDEAFSWLVYHTALGNTHALSVNNTDAPVSGSYLWNNTSPTPAAFSLGNSGLNTTGGTKSIALLFATLAGISKVGSYNGSGAAQQIDCGFSTGARLVLIHRYDGTGDWYLWDSVRGIVSGNDPFLLLNSTAAEVTSTDYIDPYAAGFELSSTAPAGLNANGGTYMFLAIA